MLGFIIFLFLNWLQPKAREPRLGCSLTHRWGRRDGVMPFPRLLVRKRKLGGFIQLFATISFILPTHSPIIDIEVGISDQELVWNWAEKPYTLTHIKMTTRHHYTGRKKKLNNNIRLLRIFHCFFSDVLGMIFKNIS